MVISVSKQQQDLLDALKGGKFVPIPDHDTRTVNSLARRGFVETKNDKVKISKGGKAVLEVMSCVAAHA